MTLFIESPRFPDKISYGARGGPKFKTRIVELFSGHEQRNIDWSTIKSEYDVSHAPRTLEEHEELLAFFLSVGGKAYGFRFKDHKDYVVLQSQGLTADLGISPSVWQMYKRYTYGSLYYDRIITKPVVGSVSVYVNGNQIDLNTSPYFATIDYTLGLIYVPNISLSDDITWSGEFDVPVRFDTDLYDAVYDFYRGITWENIKLVEIKI